MYFMNTCELNGTNSNGLNLSHLIANQEVAKTNKWLAKTKHSEAWILVCTRFGVENVPKTKTHSVKSNVSVQQIWHWPKQHAKTQQQKKRLHRTVKWIPEACWSPSQATSLLSFWCTEYLWYTLCLLYILIHSLGVCTVQTYTSIRLLVIVK